MSDNTAKTNEEVEPGAEAPVELTEEQRKAQAAADEAEAAADAAAPDPAGFRNKYVGDRKIRGVVYEGDMSVITFKDNSVETVPTVIIKRIVSDISNDHGGSFSDLKIAAITKDILILLNKAYHLRHSEVSRLTSFLNNVSENDKASATAVLWGKHATQIMLSDIDVVLTDGADKLKDIKTATQNDSTAQEIIARRRMEAMGQQ